MGKPPSGSVVAVNVPAGLLPVWPFASLIATIEHVYSVSGSRSVSLGLSADISTVG